MRKYIEAGQIVRPHGISGAVKADAWCDSPSVLAKLKKIFVAENGGYKEIKVISGSVQKDRAILLLDGVITPEEAERLRGTVLFADREDIPVPEGAYLIDDLKGLSVIDNEKGNTYGILTDVLQGGAGDIYEIKTEKGTVLIPAVKEFVKKIDINCGIFISPIKGMFDED